MSKTILLDEFLLSVRVAAGLRESNYQEVLRTLQSKRFGTRLRNVVRKLFAAHPSLSKAKVNISR